MQGSRVLFVAGYLNEMIPGYFDDNVAVVEALGARAERLFPESEASFEDNAAVVAKWIDANEGPIWLVGHSKGGAAVLLAALRSPQLVLSGKVRAVVVVQGAVLGSPVADRYDADPVLGKKGMHALTRRASETVFNVALEQLRSRLSPAEQQALFERVFYVRSRINQAAVAAELSPTRGYLDQFGPNDGLLLADSMRLSEGVDLGVLDSDHAGLVISSFLTSSTPERRRGFTHALCREVSRRLGQ
jgi:pimeloyl-ACP methyl ester carboxylesterase